MFFWERKSFSFQTPELNTFVLITFSPVTKSLKLEWNLFWEGTVPYYVFQYNNFLNLIASSRCHCDSDCPYTAPDKDDSLYFVVIVGRNPPVPMQKGKCPSATPSQGWVRWEGRRPGLSSVPLNGQLWSVFGYFNQHSLSYYLYLPLDLYKLRKTGIFHSW